MWDRLHVCHHALVRTTCSVMWRVYMNPLEVFSQNWPVKQLNFQLSIESGQLIVEVSTLSQSLSHVIRLS